MKLVDLSGQRFGKLTVICREGANSRHQPTWKCQCDCGNVTVKSGFDLKRGKLPSCGCADAEAKSKGRLEDLTNKKFGHLTVIERVNDIGESAKWLCECDCADHNRIVVFGNNLKRGHTTSCGCERKRITTESHTKHGYHHTRIYSVYSKIKDRCYNPNTPCYKRYGGRGITMCDEWRDNPAAFCEWAYANGYKEDAKYGECTIDRIDNSKGYSPDNCRIADERVQANNRRSNKYHTYNGETHTIAEWSRILNVPTTTMVGGLLNGVPFEHYVNDYKPRNTHPKK